MSTAEQKAQLEKRQQRFGATAAAANGTSNGTAAADPKLESRAKRFGSGSIDSAELDAKKKASSPLHYRGMAGLHEITERPFVIIGASWSEPVCC